MDDRFEVRAGAGTMMSGSATAVRFPHRWTPGGVTVEADFTGGHLLHQLARLLEVVDQVAEIPCAVRAGAAVRRVS
jgi:hypothetical protein